MISSHTSCQIQSARFTGPNEIRNLVQSHPTPPCPAHTRTHELQVIHWRWAGFASRYRSSTEVCYMGIKRGEKDLEKYWFGLKVILIWHNLCRKLQTSSTHQWLVDSCLSQPTSPILRPEKLRHSHSSQSNFHTELLGTLQPPSQHIKVTTVVMVSKIYFLWTSYGKTLDAAFPPARS